MSSNPGLGGGVNKTQEAGTVLVPGRWWVMILLHSHLEPLKSIRQEGDITHNVPYCE